MIKKFGPASTGMGDVLLFTSIFKYFPKQLTFQLPKEKEKYSILFEGLADVEITESENINILNSIGYGHYATTLLRNFFDHADLLDNRPLVLYTDEESEKWADDFLKEIENPIIFCPTCSETTGGINNIRSFQKTKTIEIIENLFKENLTPIIHSFNSSEVYPSNIKVLKNLELKKYICLLRKSGRFLGCNTGDMHLAISLNCLCTIIQPQSTFSFDENQWTYKHPSLTYYNF